MALLEVNGIGTLNGSSYSLLEPTGQIKSNKKDKKKLLKEQRRNNSIHSNLFIKSIIPLTETQEQIFEAYNAEKNLFICGYPGTGKTFLALYLALNELLYKKTDLKKIVILRNAVSVREIGHLPRKQ